MERLVCKPRPNWQSTVEGLGFDFHTIDGLPYWDESACYHFSPDEIGHLSDVTQQLEDMCLQAVEKIIDEERYHQLAIPEGVWPLIEISWRNRHKNLYGRFDLSYDGKSEPKLLEYNADTPVTLFESSVVQRQWVEETRPQDEQFNSIHERLLTAWKRFNLPSNLVHFTCSSDQVEDRSTVDYLAETARQVGLMPRFIEIQDIGWDGQDFVDLEDWPISALFKLYPWEWLIAEDFGKNILLSNTIFIEPAWKMILSNKGILAILWEMFPDHPNLLPAFFDANKIRGSVVQKPLLSREGANIQILQKKGRVSLETSGPYGIEGFVYQVDNPLPNFEGNYPVIGSWVIASQPAGMGIREDDTRITKHTSRFVPHFFS